MSLIWPFFLFCAFASSVSASGSEVDSARLHAIAESRYWKLLLHYRKGRWGSEESEADGAGFFFSPKGRADSYAELLATLEAFRSDKKIQVQTHSEFPQCAFPERFRFLREQLKLDIPVQSCPDFDEWKARFHARAVVLVYAAPYFGSPSSMFGHTFMRIDAAPSVGMAKNPQLDRAISFEAFTGSDGGMGYVLNGLIGNYPGVFSLHPYYLKINAYNDIESRDLWEYELNLGPEQIDRMLNHAWEMGTTYFNYYFFNRNCSYHLMSLLEVANPDWHLRENFTVATIPIDTIRVLDKIPGAIRKRAFRPALLKILEARLARTSPEERSDFYRLRGHRGKIDGHPSTQTLDALLDWQKYEAMNGSHTILDFDHQVDLELLRARAGSSGPVLTEQAAAEQIEKEDGAASRPPESGHLSSKLTVGGGAETGSGLAELGFRPAFHDYIDADPGYLPHSRLVIGDVLLQYRFHSPDTLRLQKLTLAEVINLAPWSGLKHGLSWDLGAGFYHPEDVGCPSCVAGRVRGGLGITVSPWPKVATVYALAHGQLEASSSFVPFFRFGPSGELGTQWDFGGRAKAALSFEYFKYFESSLMPRQNWSATTAQASYALSARWSLELRGELYALVQDNHARILLSTGWYF
ncbi:MAG: DUF4105 domain-containing protein [Oligoflexia bacterium]|nr:DUF4105 domain-containing protein [Oligoflexia bacterium]